MPAHTSDFSLHMKGLFQTILVQQQIISELCKSQCSTAVDELAREIAYPLNDMLAENQDNPTDYKNNSDIHPRLNAIWELMPIDEVNNSDRNVSIPYASSETTARGIENQRYKNREFLRHRTFCANLLSNILAKPALFTEAQLEMTLSVLRALFFGSSVSLEGSDLTLKKVRLLFPFENFSSIHTKHTFIHLHKPYNLPSVIEPVLDGSSFITY